MKEELRKLTCIALRLGRVERGVCHPDGKPETDTDHSVSLAWAACTIADRWYPFLNRGLVAELALAHDAVEAYAGDTYAVTAGDEGRKAQHEREQLAADRITSELGSRSWLPRMIELYERRDCHEARFVHAVDKMMPKIVLRIEGKPRERLAEQGVTPHLLRQFREYEEKLFAGIEDVFPGLCALRKEMHAELLPGDIV